MSLLDWLTTPRIWKRICIVVGSAYAAVAYRFLLRDEQLWSDFYAMISVWWFYFALHVHERMNRSR